MDGYVGERLGGSAVAKNTQIVVRRVVGKILAHDIAFVCAPRTIRDSCVGMSVGVRRFVDLTAEGPAADPHAKLPNNLGALRLRRRRADECHEGEGAENRAHYLSSDPSDHRCTGIKIVIGSYLRIVGGGAMIGDPSNPAAQVGI